MPAINHERGFLTEFEDFINTIPPITRSVLALTLALSLSLQFGVISPMQVVLLQKPLLQQFELWRLFTNVCLSSGLGLLMHLFFLYQNASSLEKTYANRKADFFIMLVFVIFSLDLFGLFMDLPVLTSAFSMALVYIWAQQHPDQIVTFMFGLQFKALLFPFVLLGVDVLTGNSITLSILGIIVGHFYHFLENIYPSQMGGQKLLVAPLVLQNFFQQTAGPTTASHTPTASSNGYRAVPGGQNRKINSETTSSSTVFGGKGYRLGTE
jgi:hypothetical protein